jgi:hypothetical protein
MSPTNRTAFVVRRPSTDAQWTGFLDMLRYDQATIIEHHADIVALLTPPNRVPTVGRWASFNLHVLALGTTNDSGFLPFGLLSEARSKFAPTNRPDRRHVTGPRSGRVHILRPSGSTYTYCNRDAPLGGWVFTPAASDCPTCIPNA